jgi:DNA-binding transcriptional MerR regulator
MTRRSALRAAHLLRRQQMPLAEIRAILTAHDPLTVHRYLELHQERLDERWTMQRRALSAIESELANA